MIQEKLQQNRQQMANQQYNPQLQNQQQQQQYQQQQLMPPPQQIPGGPHYPQMVGDNNGQQLPPCMAPLTEHKHPVSLLGELAAKRRWPLPTYAPVQEHGQPHQKQFLLLVNVNGMNYTPAQMSNTKKEAKAVAAKYALQQLGVL